MQRPFLLSSACALLLLLTALAPLTGAVGQNGTCRLPSSDTTAPFTDRCFHQGVWYSPDTTEFDVLVLPPVSPYEAREWQLAEQSVSNWEDGIRALGAPWLDGLRINDYTVGREPVPPGALSDPEVIVALHTNVLPLGMYAGAASLPPSVCHGVVLPDPTGSGLHTHGGGVGHFLAQCGGGGRLCVVTDAATLGTPTDNDRRINFDLLSHEVGHCLTLGHVGDADTESSDDSVAYPEHDIMSYENDGLHAATMHCPSNLDVRTIEKAFGALLGQPGATTRVAPHADAYVHMHPDDWQAHTCAQPTAAFDDVDWVAEADPAGLSTETDSDGDGVPDGEDACEGGDDRIDADADGSPDACDADDADGPGGDSDGDGVRNADDACPGIDDASPACLGTGGSTFYFGRGLLASPSGNADVLYGGDAFAQNNLVMDEGAPESTDPAVILAPFVDGVDAHNPFYEPAEWIADRAVSANGADVEVVWWATMPASGAGFYPAWDVQLFFDGAAQPAAEAVDVSFDIVPASLPSEYRVTLTGVQGTGVPSVVIDPAAYLNQQDALILYDAVDYPSRVVFGPDPVQDTDGDGVLDDVDACPGADDRLDLDADAVPDGCDADRDGDGAANADDWAPDDASEQADSDGDAVGDNADLCPGHDDAADWDADDVPDGCDELPAIAIASPGRGDTVVGDVTVTGTTPGTSTVAANTVRLPDLSLFPDLSAYGVVQEPWMERLDAALEGVPGYSGLIGVRGASGNTLHLVASGVAATVTPVLPKGWSLEVHAGAVAEPFALSVTRDAALAAPELPRGGVVSQGLGPGTPLYIQLDGVRDSVGICTANYLWKDHEGTVWLGAAGHCFLPETVTNADGSYDYARTEVYACRSDCALGGIAGAQAFFEWQAGAPLDFVKLGAVGYARQQGVGQDFGVVGIPAALLADLEPEVPGAGGPYGVYPDGFVGDTYLLHGNGVAVAETAATKSRVAVGDGDGGDKTSWAMVGLSNGGDSGAPVNSISWLSEQGVTIGPRLPFARGLLTHGYADPVTGLLPSIPIAFGTTVAQAIAMATEGGLCLDLVLADEDPVTRPAATPSDACAPAAVPEQVLGVQAAPADGQVALTWLAPADGGSPITGYTVRYGRDGVTDQELAVTGTAAVVVGLANGVAYTFTVAAGNAAGEGPASAPVVATPARPVRFTVEVRVDGGAWTPVDGYDETAETWQAGLGPLAAGWHTVDARLLDLGVQRAATNVSFLVAVDTDADGVPDPADNCPATANAGQADLDGDGVGDACDADRDGDGHGNDDEAAAGSDPDDASSAPATCATKPSPRKDKCHKARDP